MFKLSANLNNYRVNQAASKNKAKRFLHKEDEEGLFHLNPCLLKSILYIHAYIIIIPHSMRASYNQRNP